MIKAIVYAPADDAPAVIIDGLSDVYKEIEAVGSDDTSNHMGKPQGYGLFVWEGVLEEVRGGEEPPEWKGTYRRLTSFELECLALGIWPFQLPA